MRRFTKEEQEKIRYLYYDLEYSVPMVVKEMKTDAKTAFYWIGKFGTPRTRSEAQIVAEKHRRKKHYLREESPYWRGGRPINEYGYRTLLLNPDDPFYCMAKTAPKRLHGAYVLEHRYIMAKVLKRPLTKDEIVHHLNGIKDDNRIKNLALVFRSNHSPHTLNSLLQKRIRELEDELAQQKLL